MGWASGSLLAEEIWKIIDKNIITACHPEIALDIVNAFENYDCDTMYECDFVREHLEFDEDDNVWKIK